MLLAFAASLALQTPLPPTPPPVGTEANQWLPEVVLPTLDGKRSVALSTWQGKPLLLLQFASW